MAVASTKFLIAEQLNFPHKIMVSKKISDDWQFRLLEDRATPSNAALLLPYHLIPDDRCDECQQANDHPGATFAALGEKIMELCEFIKDRKNIHQNIRAMISCIRMTYGRDQKEKGACKPEKKVTQATQVIPPLQSLLGENAGKRSHEGVGEIPGPQQIPKRIKRPSPKKPDQPLKTAKDVKGKAVAVMSVNEAEHEV